MSYCDNCLNYDWECTCKEQSLPKELIEYQEFEKGSCLACWFKNCQCKEGLGGK